MIIAVSIVEMKSPTQTDLVCSDKTRNNNSVVHTAAIGFQYLLRAKNPYIVNGIIKNKDAEYGFLLAMVPVTVDILPVWKY